MATFPFNLHSSTSAYNLDDIRGAMCDVYEQGMLIPSAVMATNTINQTMLNTHTRTATPYVSKISEHHQDTLVKAHCH